MAKITTCTRVRQLKGGSDADEEKYADMVETKFDPKTQTTSRKTRTAKYLTVIQPQDPFHEGQSHQQRPFTVNP